MIIDNILATLSVEVRALTPVQALAALAQTFGEQLEATQQQLRSAQVQLQAMQEQLTKSQEKIKGLEEELRRLRKTPKPPKFRPNGMERRKRKKSSDSDSSPLAMNASLVQKEYAEIKIPVPNPPTGSRFKGYQSFSVQELSLGAKDITYKLEVWQTPSGEILRAELPKELEGQHFGTTLRAVMTALYAHGMTEPALQELLQSWNIDLSSGQVSNIFLNEAEEFSFVSEAILSTGLKEAPYSRVDDTGEKHQHKNGYCTHIGGQYFAYFKTTSSKSRENFLRILLQGKEGYYINEAMIWHLFQAGVEDDILNLFEEYKGKQYTSKRGIHRFLNSLGLEGKKLRQQCLEAGLVGFISEKILKSGQVLLSDRAGQFALFDHAGCWIHMERPLRKIICTSEQAEQELKQVREAIWTLYGALKENALNHQNRDVIEKLYDNLVVMKTMSPEVNAVIHNFATYRDEMLKALDHPGLPLHNNDSERDIRGVAKRRNISGSTKSDLGRKFRDGLITLKQTCFRVGYNFWDYIQRWFRGDPPDLAELVRSRYQMTAG